MNMEKLDSMMVAGVIIGGVYLYMTYSSVVSDIAVGVKEAVGNAVETVQSLGCGPMEQYDAGLCYPKCVEGYDGVGPICWLSCGPAFKSAGGRDDGAFCGKGNYSRGVGGPIHACGGGYQKEGLLCYQPCDEGYTGVGPLCWEKCQDGYTDDGATCRKNVSVISSDNADCHWLDKCGLTFDRGCSKCPAGYNNDGCTCSRGAHIYGKKTKQRKSRALGCNDNEDYDTGLCYPKCRDQYQGVGPICWQGCPAGSTDIGVSCQKRSYSRGEGVPIHPT